MEPQFNEPLYNKVLIITKATPSASSSKIKEKNLDMAKPRYSKHILSVSWAFVKLRFQSTVLYKTSNNQMLRGVANHDL